MPRRPPPLNVIDGLERPFTLLDANAIRNCFRRRPEAELETLRKTMILLAQQDHVRFIFTDAIAAELARVYVQEGNSAHYHELVDFYVPLCDGRCLRHAGERKPLELKLQRRLRPSEVFERREVAKERMRLKDPATVQRIYDAQRKQKDDELAEESAKRKDLVAELEAKSSTWKEDLLADAQKNWKKAVGSLVGWEVAADLKKLDARKSKHSPYVPQAMPSYWYAESIYLAKVEHVFIDSKKPLDSKNSLEAMPGLFDINHFGDAAYAHVLVTDDADFLTVARKAKTPVKLLTFDELAQKVLAHAPTIGTDGRRS